MPKGGNRGLTIFLIGVLIGITVLIVLLAYLVRAGKLRNPLVPELALPVDLQAVIPKAWTPMPKQYKPCDFDGDTEIEWLVIYRYDKSKMLSDGVIGGVVYDAQANRVPQAPATQSPYRPAFIMPYKLLPDIYTGKGQGYLGESDVQVSFYPERQDDKKCAAKEIIAKGLSGDAKLPVRLSIFRWEDRTIGYRGVHFVGNARIEAQPAPEAPGLITRVTTYNRLNDRSLLCEVRGYKLPPVDREGRRALESTEEPDQNTIDFCFDAPADPAYPEGVVVALLRGRSPGAAANNPSPTGSSFLTPAAVRSLQSDWDWLRKTSASAPVRILSVTTPGTVELHAGNGWICTADEVSVEPQTDNPWWCGREEAHVTTEVVSSGASPRQITWTLISLASERVDADVHWRITSVD